MSRGWLFSIGSLIALLGACAAGAGASAPCELGSDCASGVCDADGTCAEPTGSAGQTTSATTGGHHATTSSGGGGEGAGGGGGQGGSGGGSVCSPNHDGVITRAEVPLQAGLHATFRAAENVPVDTAGQMQSDGSRVWDLTKMLSGDHDELVETQALTGQWFAAKFAGATYSSRLSDSQDLLGVFRVTDSALELMGVVSPTGGLMATELTYDPPVQVLAFPIKQGATWTTKSTVTGKAEGVYSVYTETYKQTVDAHGKMTTPFDTFDVLRVRVDLDRVVGAATITTRTFLFATECFGTVASIVSENYPTTVEFTKASEITRLSP